MSISRFVFCASSIGPGLARLCLLTALLLLIFPAGVPALQVPEGDNPAPQAAPAPQADSRAGQVARLERYLSGARLTGHFTVRGQERENPREESYWIESARATGEGDRWEITARIKYGRHDVTVPMQMEIKWAGDTPVITVDRMTIPLMGTFDARVLIRGGQYAGTWSHDDVGGHLFGRIATAEEQAREQDEQQRGGDGSSPGGVPGTVPAAVVPPLPCKDGSR